ncbi:MAG: type II toxin-antitoxin system RelE/ParE family toxin [Saprospiraceae bacterium]
MKVKKHRKVVTYKDYFREFLRLQPIAVQKKIVWTLELIEDIERVPETYLKHLTGTDGLYEVKVSLGSNTYRIFCFFSDEQLVVLMNSFQKKTHKTPKSEILKALKIKEEYEQENK